MFSLRVYLTGIADDGLLIKDCIMDDGVSCGVHENGNQAMNSYLIGELLQILLLLLVSLLEVLFGKFKESLSLSCGISLATST